MSKQMTLAFCLVVAGCGPKPDFEPFDFYAAGETAIYGYVTDLYSCGLADAQILVPNSDLGALTNSRGQYRLRLLASTSYDLTVEKSGFNLASVRVDVGAEPVRHDFPLVPECTDGRCPTYRPPCQAGTGMLAVPPN